MPQPNCQYTTRYCWEAEKVKTLIRLRAELSPLFTGKRNASKYAWAVVERELSVPLPLSKIIKKWNNLLQEYKAIKLSEEPKRREWPFFALMDYYFSDQVNDPTLRLFSSTKTLGADTLDDNLKLEDDPIISTAIAAATSGSLMDISDMMQDTQSDKASENNYEDIKPEVQNNITNSNNNNNNNNNNSNNHSNSNKNTKCKIDKNDNIILNNNNNSETINNNIINQNNNNNHNIGNNINNKNNTNLNNNNNNSVNVNNINTTNNSNNNNNNNNLNNINAYVNNNFGGHHRQPEFDEHLENGGKHHNNHLHHQPPHLMTSHNQSHHQTANPQLHHMHNFLHDHHNVDQYLLSWNNFHGNMCKGFHNLQKDEKMVDVTIAAGGRIFKAHKLVLSVCSPYFQKIFLDNPSTHPILFMTDVNSNHMAGLLDFMYSGQVNVKYEDLSKFLKVAEAMQIKGLHTESTQETNDDIKQQSKPLSLLNETNSLLNKSTINNNIPNVSSPISSSPTVAAAAAAAAAAAGVATTLSNTTSASPSSTSTSMNREPSFREHIRTRPPHELYANLNNIANINNNNNNNINNNNNNNDNSVINNNINNNYDDDNNNNNNTNNDSPKYAIHQTNTSNKILDNQKYHKYFSKRKMMAQYEQEQRNDKRNKVSPNNSITGATIAATTTSSSSSSSATIPITTTTITTTTTSSSSANVGIIEDYSNRNYKTPSSSCTSPISLTLNDNNNNNLNTMNDNNNNNMGNDNDCSSEHNGPQNIKVEPDIIWSHDDDNSNEYFDMSIKNLKSITTTVATSTTPTPTDLQTKETKHRKLISATASSHHPSSIVNEAILSAAATIRPSASISPAQPPSTTGSTTGSTTASTVTEHRNINTAICS